jgi:hypothetical protein
MHINAGKKDPQTNDPRVLDAKGFKWRIDQLDNAIEKEHRIVGEMPHLPAIGGIMLLSIFTPVFAISGAIVRSECRIPFFLTIMVIIVSAAAAMILLTGFKRAVVLFACGAALPVCMISLSGHQYFEITGVFFIIVLVNPAITYSASRILERFPSNTAMRIMLFISGVAGVFLAIVLVFGASPFGAVLLLIVHVLSIPAAASSKRERMQDFAFWIIRMCRIIFVLLIAGAFYHSLQYVVFLVPILLLFSSGLTDFFGQVTLRHWKKKADVELIRMHQEVAAFGKEAFAN